MDWKRIWEVAERALGLEADACASFLDEACGDDLGMRREVEALVAVFEKTDVPAGNSVVATEIFPPAGANVAVGQLRVGLVVDDKYRIDGVLGAGGMGDVYRATHMQLERPVALKAIRSGLIKNRVLAERFRREAVAVARLRHPNIVTVHDYGVARDVGAYLVMELLEGRSLRAELTERTQFDVETALPIVAQICEAVGAAHEMGVIHRDLKPENIFLEERDGAVVVKVVDFGLARLDAELQSLKGGLTHSGEVLGTPGYISPEQCRGDEADARSDVYAIGCMVYELLAGVRPFTGKNMWEVIYKHVNDEPRRPSEFAPDLPPTVEAALLRALIKSPAERHQTVGAFAEALGAVAPDASPTPIALPPAAKRTANNLPHAITRFVGRAEEIDEVRGWLERARLVTLVGPGGIGKTRMALETAARVLDEYEDGVWLVELAPLADPGLVAHAVGAALGVRDQGGRSDLESVVAWLRDRRTLLVLDNCEHLVAACAELTGRLLGACAGLRILATSQESLAVAGEVAWPVPALGSEATQLFVDRASLAKPGFEETDSVANVVAELCRRLEGIPLAIELAAARVKALSVEQILERLHDRFRLLEGGNRGTPSRQQTLRAALDWSYDLLTDEERALLLRLSVFAGGWTLETAEAVAGGEDVLHALSRLVDKSLVIAKDYGFEERFRMLESVREYAFERLRESGEATEVARRHASVFVALAETARKGFVGSQEAEWLAKLEVEHDNMRAALAWLLENDVDECLHLAGELSGFWSLHGHFLEGSRWMAAAVDRSGPGPSLALVVAIRSIGEYAMRMGDPAGARGRFEESLRMARALGDRRQIGWSAFYLALALQQQGEQRASCAYFEESQTHGEATGDDRLVGNALNSLGEAARIEGEWASACTLFEQSLEIHRRMGHLAGVSVTLCNLGAALCEGDDLEAARSCYREALPSLRELGNTMGVSLALDGLGSLAAKRGEWERAARLAGSAEALREAIGAELELADRSTRERCLQSVREHLDEPSVEAALAEGRAMEVDRAIEYAMDL